MRLISGTRIGRYDILGRLGAGGMGEVYRARDSRLDKTVAIKVIASGFVDDPAAGPRFDRERVLTAGLDHPHICRLLDAGHDDGVTYLAMEYLHGEPLSDRLSRGAIPVREALGYAIEIAEALGYAHGRGVVHRDLKPGNVYITGNGIKVLDFGLAKLRPARSSAAAQGDTAPLLETTPGTLIGTALYMAPERLEGGDADERSDIFSFGLVLYEMLAGRPAFQGQSMASLIAAVMTGEAPPLMLRDGDHEELEWVVRKCLAKSPDERWRSMCDIAAVLKRLAGRRATSRRQSAGRSLTAAAMLLGMLLAGVGWWGWRPAAAVPPAKPIAFRVEPPPDGGFSPTANSVQSPMLAVSPDGGALAYVAAGPDRVPHIWIRRFDAVDARPLRGSEDAMFPFWSPNGRSIGFFSEGTLKRIDLAGGPARVLAAAPDPCGATWSAAGVILFAPSVKGGLKQIPAEGGQVADVTRPDSGRGQTSHRWPRFVNGGPQYLYFARAADNEDVEGIYLASLDSPSSRLVAKSPSAGEFLAPDRLLYLSDGSLVAQPFDPAAGRVSGDAVLLADRVAASSNYYAAFSVSATGTLAFASLAGESELTWFNRAGQPLAILARGGFVDFRLSPDNTHLAVAETDPHSGHPDLYLVDVKRSTTERLTSSRVSDGTPTWSPDGRELLFRSNREAVHDLYRRPAFGTSPERPFLKSAAAKYPTSWSRDGRTILFHTLSDRTGWDVWTVGSDGSAPTPVIQTPYNEAQAQLSPDGRWIAYAADERSSFEVYLQRATREGRRWRVSSAGGADPRWNPDGSEVFFVASDRWLTSVSISPTGEPGTAQRLFKMPDVPALPPYTSTYDVAADGQRFLVRVPRADLRTLPLTVVVNWRAASGAAPEAR